MYRYVVRRLLLFIPTMLGAATLIFLIMRIVPGDVATLILGGYGGEGGIIKQGDLNFFRDQIGLNRPLLTQFFDFIGGAVRGDLGTSVWTQQPVLSEIRHRMPLDIQIVIMSAVIAFGLGIPFGILSALRQDEWLDYVVRTISIMGLAVPVFWLGIVIVLMLVTFFNWSAPLENPGFFKDPSTNMQQLAWPIVVVAFRQSAVILRMTRATMLEVLREDFIRTARAKGLAARVVTWRHALRNAMLPVVTIGAMELAVLLGGLVLTEKVFNVPGMGAYLADSILKRDFPVVQGIILVLVAVILVVNLITDISYSWLDPRVRYN